MKKILLQKSTVAWEKHMVHLYRLNLYFLIESMKKINRDKLSVTRIMEAVDANERKRERDIEDFV